MVCLIDNDKANTSRTCKAIAMDRQELRRRENDAGAARSQAGKHVIARCLHGLAGQHAHANAERSHRRREVISLVGNERAQRIDKDARPPTKDRLARGVHMEDERLAAPRPHNGQDALVSASASSASTCARCGWFEPIKLWISERVSSV